MPRSATQTPVPSSDALERLRKRGEAAAAQVSQAPVARLETTQRPEAAPDRPSAEVTEVPELSSSADSPSSEATPVVLEAVAVSRGTGRGQLTSKKRRKSTTRDDVRHPVVGPRGRLGANGEKVVKLTMELPEGLVDRLNAWEESETRRTGKRVHRERLIDLALDSLPEDIDGVLALTESLPESYLDGELEPIGTRIRASVQAKLLTIRPQLKIRRMSHVYQWHVYAAAIDSYLNCLEVVEAKAGEQPGTPEAVSV